MGAGWGGGVAEDGGTYARTKKGRMSSSKRAIVPSHSRWSSAVEEDMVVAERSDKMWEGEGDPGGGVGA